MVQPVAPSRYGIAFGERGFPIVVFPTSGGRFWEYEERGMVNALRPSAAYGRGPWNAFITISPSLKFLHTWNICSARAACKRKE